MVSYLLLVQTLAAFTTALPHATQDQGHQKRSFRVDRHPNPNFSGANGPRALAKAYRKHGANVPDNVAAASYEQDVRLTRKRQLENRALGIASVPAVPLGNDVAYVSPMTIGGQTLDLNLDTGSSDLWVFNTKIDNAESLGHTLYDPDASSTFTPLSNFTFSISYGDGSKASGHVGLDSVSFGDITAPRQAVQLPTNVSKAFLDDESVDGLVGLAFSSLNTIHPQKQSTFFETILPTLREPVFTADLRRLTNGSYEFGRIDDTKFIGPLTWVPVAEDTKGFWEFTSETYTIGANNTAEIGRTGGRAIADTGTTLILAYEETVRSYYSHVEGAKENSIAGGFVFPCNSTLPDLTLDVGGYRALIPGEELNYSQAGDNICYGGLQLIPTGSSLQIFGDIFFKSHFVAFNAANRSMGFAEHI